MNKYCFPNVEPLTQEEIKARDIMVNLFNPVLKFIIMSKNFQEFYNFGFNSCRQTAILGTAYIEKLLPDYSFAAYEGQFVEQIDRKPVPYIHAFIIASKGNRKLLIDLSRTTKRLLFTPVYSNIYPTVDEYSQMVLLNKHQIDVDEMINTSVPEYLTELKPKDLLVLIGQLVSEMTLKDTKEQNFFRDKIYNDTTEILKIGR